MPELIRRVIFDVPTSGELLPALGAAHPGVRFRIQERWEPTPETPAGEVPVWWWHSTAEAFVAQADVLYRAFAYPLRAGETSFIVALPFGRDVFAPRSLALDRMGQLDAEDVGRLLCEDALDTTWHLLGTAADRMAETPIEMELGAALEGAGIPVKRQVQLAGFRPDFLVEHRGRQLVVEADGRAFHDPATDAVRDAALRAHGVERVIRFTGSQIYRDPAACASAVRAALEGARKGREVPADASLDPSQARAASHLSGAARVLAPAGAGKTKTMVAHVLELLRQGVPPGSILVLAFNKKAAEQLRQRLGQMGVPLSRDLVPYSDGVFCSTFHAFGYRYLKQVLGRPPSTDGDARVWRRLMEDALGDCGMPLASLQAMRGSDPLGQFLKAVDRAKADLQPPEAIAVEIESFSDVGNRVIGFGPVWNAFQRRQLDAGVSSFDDHLYLTVRDLLQSPARRRALQDRFEHVLVDEFQDLNEAQLAVVDIVSRPERNLFIVGDDDQLIYGWRFAKASNILDFHQWVPAPPYSQTYTLTTNYRCARAVVETSRRLIDRNQRREPKDFHPRSAAPQGVVRFVPSPSWNARASEIADFLRTERARLGCKWQQLAVLCRFKSQQAPTAMALDAASIPRSRLLRYRLYTHQAALLLRDYIDLVLRPEEASGDLLGRVLNRPNRYIRRAEVDRIRGASHPWAALSGRNADGDLAPRAGAALVRTVEALHRGAVGLPAGAFLDAVVGEFELERYWTDQVRGAGGMDQDEAGPLQVLRILQMLADDLPDRASFLGQWDIGREREVAAHDVEEDTLAREEPETDDHVVIGTIHSAKGREYQAVVLVDYDPDVSRLTDVELEEERRVLYVGVTRAQQSLMVTIDERKGVNPLVGELIAPRRAADDESHLEAEIERCRTDVLEGTIALERTREELAEIEDGREEARLARALSALRDAALVQEGRLGQSRAEFEAVGGGPSVPIESTILAALQSELAAARARVNEIDLERAELAAEQARIRERGGWWPMTDVERAHWEAEVDQLQRRLLELDLAMDQLQAEGSMGGIRAAWARLSGMHAERERRRAHLEGERAKRTARKDALLQGRNVAEDAQRREAEAGVLRERVQRLEHCVAARTRFEQADADKARVEAEAKRLQDRLNVLRAQPELLSGELRRQIQRRETEIAAAQSRKAGAESRMIELALLGG